MPRSVAADARIGPSVGSRSRSSSARHPIGSGREDRDRGNAAGRRRRRHLRGGQVGDGVLDEMGHELRLCAGEVDALRYQARLVPPMHFTWPPAARVTAAAFDPDSDPDAVRAEIDRLADLLAARARRLGRRRTQLDAAGRRERVGHPDAPAPRRRAAPHRGGARAAGHRPPPRLLVGARAVRAAASCPRCSRRPSRPTCRRCGTSASTAWRPASCASAAASSRRSSRTCSTSIGRDRGASPADASPAARASWG